LGVTGKTDNSVTLSWQVVPDATGYKVYKGTSSGAVNEYVAGTASVSCIVTGLGTNMDYYFTVSAVHESVESLPSVVVQGKTLHQYTVTFDADGGSPVTQTRTVGSGFSLGSSNMPSAPDRNGDTFNGWYTAANGEGSEFTAGTPVTGDITVYAWWKMPDNLSLDAALTWIGNYAVTGDTYTITLKNDETIAPKSLSYSGKTVGITLNGGTTERTVGLSTTGALFTVESGVTLTLGSNVTLRGRSDNTDSLVRVNSGGTLVMNTGSKISGNTASSDSRGGGVYVNGTFEMSGGEISGNKASGSNSSSLGGGVYVNIGTFEMSGGKISGNTASSSSSYGGGVYVYAGTFEMSDGEISGNKASGGGGGVYVAGGPFEMSGGEISGNTASSSYSSSSYGGGVYVNGTFEMSGGEISGNTASSAAQSYSSYGGGVYVYYYYGGEYNGTFTKSGGGTISDTNTATSGKVAYVSSNPYKRRNATAGPSVNMDSRVSGTAGGWE
jgi:uncharacterized repeat protein (TIGR02543 family)